MDGSPIIRSLDRIDKSLTLCLNSLDHPLTDQLWIFMSDKLVWVPAYALCLFFLVRNLGWRRAAVVLGTVLLAFLACDQLSNLVKSSVARLRPHYSSEMLSAGLSVLERRAGRFGFFSAHAANSFSLAVCLSMGFRNDKTRKYTAFAAGSCLWAALVSLSRVFVGKHYLGDILVGGIVGVLVGWGLGLLGEHLIRKIDGRDRNQASKPTSCAGPSPSSLRGSL